MMTQALTQVDPKQFFQPTAPAAPGSQRLDTKVSAVAISSDLDGRLSVMTAEGDKIKLTADLEYDFRAVNYASAVQTDNATVDVDAKFVEASLKREFGVTVEGDLNEQGLKDLEKIFHKVSNMFRKFLSGQDEEALAKTAQLAEPFGSLSSLSSLDLSVNVDRAVTALAADIASEVTGQPAAPRPQELQTPTAPSSSVIPGKAPAAAAAIPQQPTGTTAPTPSSPAAQEQPATDGVRLSTPAQPAQPPASLVQQVFDALKDTQVETSKIQKYLPSFLQQLREDLIKDMRERQEHKEQDSESPASQDSLSTNSSLLVAYLAVQQTSISLSIHS